MLRTSAMSSKSLTRTNPVIVRSTTTQKTSTSFSSLASTRSMPTSSCCACGRRSSVTRSSHDSPYVCLHQLVISFTQADCLQVATNPVFLLDDQEDDFEAVSAMAKHMYSMSYGKHSLNTGRFEPKDDWILDWEQVLNHQLAVYTATDKYDCPVVRRAARELMNICLGGTTFPAPSGMKTVNFTRLALVFVSLISKICGPDGPQLADQSLYRHSQPLRQIAPPSDISRRVPHCVPQESSL